MNVFETSLVKSPLSNKRQKLRTNVEVNTPEDHPDIDAFLSSEDDEEINTIGNVPVDWYEEFEHVGYTRHGERLERSEEFKEKDPLTELLEKTGKAEGGDDWRYIKDPKNNTSYYLSDGDLKIIRCLSQGRVATVGALSASWGTENDSETEKKHPLNNRPVSKKSFLVPVHELRKINKLVKLIKENRLPPKKSDEEEELLKLWQEESQLGIIVEDGIVTLAKAYRFRLPSLPLPTDKYSYNPPPEYLLNSKERRRLMARGADNNSQPFIPMKHDRLLHVSMYPYLVDERFRRYQDLFQSTRIIKKKLDIIPESLLPAVPPLKDLRPFPSKVALQFIWPLEIDNDSLKSTIKRVSADATGRLLAASVGPYLALFEIESSRPICWHKFDQNISALEFNPQYPILAIGIESSLHLCLADVVAFGSGDKGDQDNADVNSDAPAGEVSFASRLETARDMTKISVTQSSNAVYQWSKFTSISIPSKALRPRITIHHPRPVAHITWHCNGMYMGAACPTSSSDHSSSQSIIHALAKQKSYRFLGKHSGGRVGSMGFYAHVPRIAVGTQSGIKVFDLKKRKTNQGGAPKSGTQGLVAALSGTYSATAFAVHPKVDVVIVACDNSLVIYDSAVGSQPCRSMRVADEEIRDLSFHARYPLLVSVDEKGIMFLAHVSVTDDIAQELRMFPIMSLVAPQSLDVPHNKIVNASWHPQQAWLFSIDNAGNILMWV